MVGRVRGGLVWGAALALVLAVPRLPAQVPLLYTLDSRQHPPGIDWRRLDTPHFTVVFPATLGAEAQRAATLLEGSYATLGRSLRAAPDRIPVVLAGHSLTANAYVGWGPRRSQWYPLPPTTVDAMGPVDWYTLLAVHEGRHIVQDEAVRSGFVGLASRLFGDYTRAFLGGALYVPSWFWEGDAVGLETALTAAGRGRQPSFLQRVRALRLAGADYPFHPAWNGSYETRYPGWYELGYILTTHVRRTYGDSTWRAAIRRATWNPLAPQALSMALERVTGRTLTELHRDAIVALDETWSRQRAAVQVTPARVVAAGSADYRQWLYPQIAGDGSLIALYSDLATPKRLVRVRGGRTELLARDVGLTGELQFHVQGAQVVWSEYELSPRWGEENFLVVKRLDLATGAVTRLTDRSRYFAPALSPDGSRIAAVHFSLGREAALVVLDAVDGRELQRLANPAGHFLVTPAWAPDGRSLYAVAVDRQRGNALVRVALDGSAADTVIPFTHAAISRPSPSGGRVFFGSPRSGIDNLHVVDTATGAIAQVTARPLGAMWGSASPDGTRLVFSDYSVHGYDAAEMTLDSARWTAVVRLTSDEPAGAAALAAQEGGTSLLDTLAVRSWPTRPFRGPSRLFDFHSLSLAPTSDEMNTGLAVESRNLLNTFGLSAGVVFNRDERTAAFEAGASHAGLPVIADVAVRLGSRASTYTDSGGRSHPFTWNERSLNAALRLPLARVVGQVRQSVVASAGAGVTEIRDQPVQFRFENNNGRFTPLTYALAASHVRPAAYRDLLPTGAAATLLYRHTPLGSDYRAHQSSARGALYLPGAFTHHALVLDAAHEEQRPANYRFSAQFLFPRGYRSRFHERFTRAGAAYHLPLLYPDRSLGHWLYLRRVQGMAFGDYGRGATRTGSGVATYRSAGSELTAEISLFGLRQFFRTGVRVSRLFDGAEPWRSEWIVGF